MKAARPKSVEFTYQVVGDTDARMKRIAEILAEGVYAQLKEMGLLEKERERGSEVNSPGGETGRSPEDGESGEKNNQAE
jgi:predicted deacylase